MMETKISGFHTSFYIPAIHKFAFHIPPVCIIGTNHRGKMRHTAFKRHELFQDVLCRRDYSDRVVAKFSNKTQSEYYGVNRYVSIEGILLEHFSAVPQADITSSTLSRQRHVVFNSFLSDNRKQDSATTNAHSRQLISLLKYKNIFTASLCTISENTGGCAEQYRCASAPYLMSVMS